MKSTIQQTKDSFVHWFTIILVFHSKLKMNFESHFAKIISNLTQNRMDLAAIDKTFHSCSNNSDRIQIVLEMDKTTNALQLQYAIYLHQQEIRKPQKSNQLSTSIRSEGNTLYHRKQSSRALLCYNNSILVGEGVSLALAYGNRSAVLYDMKHWHHSLRDIQLALDQGYPKELEYKLRERQGNCLLKINNTSQAFISFSQAKDLLTSSSEHPGKLAAIEKKLKKLEPIGNISSMKLEDIEKSIIQFDEVRKATPDKIRGTNPLLPCASEFIELAQFQNRGRSLIATQELDPGTTIIVEKAFVSILAEEFAIIHCHYCLHWAPGPIPCHRCSQVSFCSTGCRDEAWSSYHQHECGLTELLRSTNVNDTTLLALRTVLKVDRQTLIKAHDDRSLAKEMYKNYGAIHRLEGNTALRSGADLFRMSVLAVYLINLVRGENDAELSTALLHLLQSYPCNSHGITQLIVPSSSCPAVVAHVYPGEIGSAIFPISSLMNHSCDPNVVRISYGDVLVVKAIRRIKCGEEILDNYGYNFATQTKEERQLKLQQLYQFKCCCTPCEENWPVATNIPANQPSIFEALKADLNQFYYKQSCNSAPGQMTKWATKFEGYLNIIDDDPSIHHPNLDYMEVQKVLILCYKFIATVTPLYKSVSVQCLSEKLNQIRI